MLVETPLMPIHVRRIKRLLCSVKINLGESMVYFRVKVKVRYSKPCTIPFVYIIHGSLASFEEGSALDNARRNSSLSGICLYYHKQRASIPKSRCAVS